MTERRADTADAAPATDPAPRADALRDLRLFRTVPHACGYWSEREATDLVLDPQDPRLPMAYEIALGWGFRRSGALVYRPQCAHCHACVPVRVPVAAFRPDRSQRRCLARNADLHTRIAPAERSEAHLALYRRYLRARHPDGGMSDHDAHDFDQFLLGAWDKTRFMEIHAGEDLLAVAVTDVVDDALSAVYTFYDPDAQARGLGTYAILQQIAWAAREGRPFVYLGYWIEGHPKMGYKQRFQPLQAFDGRRWAPLESSGSPPATPTLRSSTRQSPARQPAAQGTHSDDDAPPQGTPSQATRDPAA